MSSQVWLPGWLLLLAFVPGGSSLEQPLPDKESFLEQVRQNLRSNRELLSQYTFHQRRVTHELTKSGEVKKSEERLWEVYPAVDPESTERRLIEVDGLPVKAEKLAKQDRKQKKKVEKELRQDPEKREQRLVQAREKEAAEIAEAFRLFEFHLEGREHVDGRSTIRVRFQPRPDFRPASKNVRQLKKIRGTAWIHAADHQLVRLEAELIKPISIGWGLAAKLHKGARLLFSRQLINGEIWLPSESRVTASARLLLFKGLRIESIDTYSDFRKFSVQTTVRFDAQ